MTWRISMTLFFVAMVLGRFSEGHQPDAFAKEDKFLIKVPVLDLYQDCSEESGIVTQGIYGHSVYLIHNLREGWGHIQTEDGHQGYGRLQALVPDNPRWRTSARLRTVCSTAGLVFGMPDLKSTALMRIPFDSRVEVVDESGKWVHVQLADGGMGWMQKGNLEKPQVRTLSEVLELSYQFLGIPYVWGGTSSMGFDCSGFVQTLFKKMGILLPRDSHEQAVSEKGYPVDSPEQPGDLLFFGKDVISHVGIYLGNGRFIHASGKSENPKIIISELGNANPNILEVRRLYPVGYSAFVHPITDDVEMGQSWREDNPVALEDLRYIELNHWGFDGCVHRGEMIVHRKVSEEVVEIFKELFRIRYPIEKILLMDAYQASDDLACEDNNTSAFCSRSITGSTTEWSYHSYGLAIDVNTLLNPYLRLDRAVPKIGMQFMDRTIDCRGLITEDDPCFREFMKRGWKWGGHWAEERGYVDYQHFYKD